MTSGLQLTTPTRPAVSRIGHIEDNTISELQFHRVFRSNHEDETLRDNSGTNAHLRTSSTSAKEITGGAVSQCGPSGSDPRYPVDFFEGHSRSAAVYPDDVEFLSRESANRTVKSKCAR